MLFVILSSILLSLSFPNFNLWPLAWMALVPAFFSVSSQKKWLHSFIQFYLIGFFFHLAGLEWMRHVTYFGWLFTVLYQSIFVALFGLCVHWFWSRKKFLASLVILPCAWALIEFIRTEIPVLGFGWNLLAYSQSQIPLIRSTAAFLGAYGVSAIIVLGNLAIFFALSFFINRKKMIGFNVLISVLSLLVIVFLFSFHYLSAASTNQIARVAVIQGNIPQSLKWNPEEKPVTIKKYIQLTSFIQDNPDLIVWPEAAFPGFFNYDLDRTPIVEQQRKMKVPFLIGSPHLQIKKVGSTDYDVKGFAYNSAYLLDQDGLFSKRYDKIRLVPFGEFIPWQSFFHLFGLDIIAKSLGVSDFQPGAKPYIFSLPSQNRKLQFATLICFEDIFPSLARKSVKEGAQFLVVITNDAWFHISAAPYQHLQASIFRAVENGVPLVRAANTGISGFINSTGVVEDRVKDAAGHDLFIAGGLSRPIDLSVGQTFYQRVGYLFPLLCFIILCIYFTAYYFQSKRR